MDRERIGKYWIVGELGRGTMGEVYKAHDPVLNRFVALKTLAVRASPGDAETLDRFKREAQAAAPLHHPNIVTVHDFGAEDDLLYMAMELLEGTDLRDAIDTDLLKTLDERLDVMDGILAALDYAHAKGVVHRDIKPANIHLGPGRQVKIMDFGLARVSTSEMTQEGIVLGTPNYMSPEQALGDKVDGRSDLFSAGAVLYEMLTGHKPFEADSTPSVLFQVVHREPPPVRRWAPDVPAAIVAVVNRALEKDRSKRFSTAAEMRSALAAARQAAAAGPGPKPPPLPRTPRPIPPPLPASATPTVLPDSSAATAPPLPAKPRVPTPRPMSSPEVLRTSMPEPPPGWTKAASPAGRPYRRPLLLGAGLAAVAVAVALVADGLRGRPAPAPGPTEASATIDTLTQELVRKQVQLARRELEGKNYAAARAEAEGALKLAPGHAEATALLSDARGRTLELERAIGAARRLVEAGDTQGASRELSRALELDPRHPAASELSARLNSAFRAQADQAAASMRAGRTAAIAAGVPAEALQTADEASRRAEALVTGGNFADATRLFLEARDAFDRSRRDAMVGRATAATPSPGRGTAEPILRATPAAVATPHRPLPGQEAAPSATAPATTPVVARGFVVEGTSVATPSAGGIEGFDSSDVSTRRPPQFSGRMEFEVLPPAVRPGEPFVVRIHLRNDGRRAVKVRGIALATVVDGRPVPAPAKLLQREVPALSRALVAEYSGVWGAAGSWALEAVLTADRNETVSSRLRAN